MNAFRSEDVLVGFIALAVVPMIALRMLRGMREGRLPVYRTYVSREEGAAKFNALLALHALSFVIMTAIGLDLLFGLGFREAL